MRIMKSKYGSKILRNLPYYSKDIIERLEKMEDYYTCLIRPELISDVDCSDFIEKELFKWSMK
jgi:predicted DNA-binding protein